MSFIDQEHDRLIDQMTIAETVQRSFRMALWAREVIARQIRAERGPMSE